MTRKQKRRSIKQRRHRRVPTPAVQQVEEPQVQKPWIVRFWETAFRRTLRVW